MNVSKGWGKKIASMSALSVGVLMLAGCSMLPSNGVNHSSEDMAGAYEQHLDATATAMTTNLTGWTEALSDSRRQAQDVLDEIEVGSGRVFAAEQLTGYLQSTENTYNILVGGANKDISSILSTFGEVTAQYHNLHGKIKAVNNSFIEAPEVNPTPKEDPEEVNKRVEDSAKRKQVEEDLQRQIAERQEAEQRRQQMEEELQRKMDEEKAEREAQQREDAERAEREARERAEEEVEDPGIDNQGDGVPEIKIVGACGWEECTEVDTAAFINGESTAIYVPAGGLSNVTEVRKGMIVDLVTGEGERKTFNVYTVQNIEDITEVNTSRLNNVLIVDNGNGYTVMRGAMR
jgi:multidrug efflux pump subunit AcrA (membrane-fusion protein)